MLGSAKREAWTWSCHCRDTYGDATGPALFPATPRYRSRVLPATERLLYRPLVAATLLLASGVRRLQNGYLSAYIAYILIVLLIALIIFTGIG